MIKQRLGFVSRARALAGFAISYLSGGYPAYPSLDSSRKEIFNTGIRPRYGSADQTVAWNASMLSSQCRHIERFTCVGRGVVEGSVADIVGTGIDVLPTSGIDGLNEKLHAQWQLWAETALVDGRSLWEWQQMVVRELYTSGAAVARWVVLPERAEAGLIPLAILPLELEWLSESALRTAPEGLEFIRGVEVDKYGRPVNYHVKKPTIIDKTQGEIVPAENIIHIFERRRSMMTHGEAGLIPAVERLLQDGRLVETELKAANATAAPAIGIKSPARGLGDGQDDEGDEVSDIPAGAVVRLNPGEDLVTIQNNRPSQMIAPFRGTIRGDLAAACRVSQYWLDRDASRANFSSMRMDQLLTQRVLVGLKNVVGRGSAGNVYQRVFPWLMLNLGVALPQSKRTLRERMAYELRPDSPPYVDPMKDVAASESAIAGKLSTHEIELSSRGKDWRQVFSQSEVEDREKDAAALRRIMQIQPEIDKLNAENPGLNLHWSQIVSASGAAKDPSKFLSASGKDVKGEAGAAVELDENGDPKGQSDENAQDDGEERDSQAIAGKAIDAISAQAEKSTRAMSEMTAAFLESKTKIERDAAGAVTRACSAPGAVQVSQHVIRDARGLVTKIVEERTAKHVVEKNVVRNEKGLVDKIVETVKEA